MDINALIQKYDQPVPRYTSYPTAVHFNHSISQRHYLTQLEQLNAEQAVSLYLHIPFCHILCHYCGCQTKAVNSYSAVNTYVQSLLKEIELVGKSLTHKISVSHLHFGGGSPNFLSAGDLGKIMGSLSRYFDLTKDAEIAMETDPRLMDDDKIKTLAELGFTRISLGVQDFNPEVQDAVNRVQPFAEVQHCVNTLREQGINKINFDLMLGLPLQTLAGIKQTVTQAISLQPDRLAVFAYAHVPWMKKHQVLLEKYPMPGAKLRFDMAMCIKQELNWAGYQSIGIDHFALPTDSLYTAQQQSRLRRNFQGYTDDQAQDIIGFGLSSISFIGGSYMQNSSDSLAYRQSVRAGKYPVNRGRVMTKQDQQRHAVIEKIMCGYQVDVCEYAGAIESLKGLKKDKLLTIDGTKIQVTEKGWPFARIVAAHFDDYYQVQEGQHARAI